MFKDAVIKKKDLFKKFNNVKTNIYSCIHGTAQLESFYFLTESPTAKAWDRVST